MLKQNLTICSVSFRSKRYLELNWELVKNLNPNQQLTWIVIENTPPESSDRLNIHSTHFLVSEGYGLDTSQLWPASYHHGIALNRALSLVNTRFALLLDPDFYVVRKSWITEVLEHVEENRLAFFGVPYHPKWHLKYRYFPCAHCMFIDLAKINKDSLDFRTGENPPKLRGRQGIGASQDTGRRVYNQYGRDVRVRSDCVLPVHRTSRDHPKRSRLWHRVLDKLLPDHLSYLPKRPGYYSITGFRELGYPDVISYDWEEFMWKGEPFGFHIRGQSRGNRNAEREIDVLLHLIASFSGRGNAR